MRTSIYFFNVFFLLSIVFLSSAQDKPSDFLGHWGMDSFDMPYFSYTGDLPYEVYMKNGKKARIADDPYFLLGNYRFKFFAHVSGEYELYSTERVISHFNTKENSEASIQIGSNKIKLTGVHSIAGNADKTSRIFGAGFAEYSYDLKEIKCKRIFSVLPSNSINDGISAVRITVFFENISDKEQSIQYQESLKAKYARISNTKEHNNLNYQGTFESLNQNLVQCATSVINPIDEFPIIKPDDYAYEEYFPPTLFMFSTFEGENKWELSGNICKGKYATILKPGETKSIDFVLGYSLQNEEGQVEQVISKLMDHDYTLSSASEVSENPFAEQWSKSIDHYESESDQDLRRELIWHNYVLESLATYSDYFKETFIPQGCMYFFSWGLRAAPRDQNQHALAACYTNPELAKSVIRYILKKSDRKGNIPFQDLGNGVVTSKYYQTSDQQLFFFMLISEYLRITGDYEFLQEEVAYYPSADAGTKTVLKRIGEYYRYLKEEVGLGPHGLIRLGNSDWNDLVFYRLKSQYNTHYLQNESLMNTTMAASIIPKLTTELNKATRLESFKQDTAYIANLTNSMMIYRNTLWDSFKADHGNRSFAKRMYFANNAVGEKNMFLEPQGFLMQVDDYSLDQKKLLYKEIKERILDVEKIGARQEEKEELSEYNFGSRENGGIWYSLNGPLIIGLATWNKEAAWELYHKMTLKNQMIEYPQYWSCYWSSFDSVDSSILPSEALHTQEVWIADGTKMTYCSHIHAWLLYSYKYLSELD